jgi:hypothetical protein
MRSAAKIVSWVWMGLVAAACGVAGGIEYMDPSHTGVLLGTPAGIGEVYIFTLVLLPGYLLYLWGSKTDA